MILNRQKVRENIFFLFQKYDKMESFSGVKVVLGNNEGLLSHHTKHRIFKNWSISEKLESDIRNKSVNPSTV